MAELPKITDEQKARITQWLDDHGYVSRPCSCGATAWTAGDAFYGTPIVGSGGECNFRDEVVTMLPMVAIICTNCGLTNFVNAVYMGVL